VAYMAQQRAVEQPSVPSDRLLLTRRIASIARLRRLTDVNKDELT